MASEALTYMKQMMQAAKEQTGGLKIPTLNDDYLAIRQAFDEQSMYLPAMPGVEFEPAELGGVPVEFARPGELSGETIVYYIHGGGFAFGNAQTSRAYASALADAAGLVVCSISYRLAPENPAPAAAEDCLAVYRALQTAYPGRPIVILGESGGGNLSLVTTLMARAAGLPLPAAVGSFSPVTDLARDLPSRAANAATDLVVPGDVRGPLIESYVRDLDPAGPFLSPLNGDYAGFPPLFVVVDKSEVLYDDAVLLVEKARAAAVEVEFLELTETYHSFAIMGRICPESSAILDQTVTFIQAHTT